MTNDTNYRGKANAVFFAAIMVVSMFAVGFAAAPAAATVDAVGSASGDDVEIGQNSVTEQVTISGIDSSTGATGTITIPYSGLSASVSATGATVASDGFGGSASATVNNGDVVITTPNEDATGVSVTVDVTFDTSGQTVVPNSQDISVSGDAGSATLTVNYADTTAPSLSNAALSNDGSGNLTFTFDSDEELGTATSDIAVTVDGPDNNDVYTFDGSQFTVSSSSGTFTYTLGATQAYDDGFGDYTATVDTAQDAAGNDASTVSDSYNRAGFEITNVQTSSVIAGNDVEVTATIKNGGTSAATQTLSATVGSIGSDAASLSLAAGQTSDVTFTVPTTSGDAGTTATITVNTDEDSDASTSVDILNDGPNFAVTVDPVSPNVNDGSPVQYDVTIENTGTQADTQDIDLDLYQASSVTGTPVQEDTLSGVQLDAGETSTQTVSLDVSPSSPPTDYTLDVISSQTSDSATVSVQPTGDFVRSDYDRNLTDGQTAFQGQRVRVDTTPFSGTTSDIELRRVNADGEVGALVSSPSIQSDASGSTQYFILDTEDRDTDRYVLTDQSRGTSVSTSSTNLFTFEVVAQDLTADFVDDTVGDTGDDALVDYDIESDVRSSPFAVTIGADGLDEEDFEQIFSNEYSTDVTSSVGDGNGEFSDADASVYQVDSASAGEYALNSEDGTITLFSAEDSAQELNFTDIAADDYEFNASVADATAEDTNSITVNSVGDGELNIEESSLTQEQGDVVEFNVTADGSATSGTVVIGNEADFGYQANVSVDDLGSDDQITLAFNTYTAGITNKETVSIVDADDDDSITVEYETNLNDLLASGNYDISSSSSATYQNTVDSADDITTLFIEQRSTEGVQLWTASQSSAEDVLDADEDEQLGALTGAVEDDLITQADTVAHGDVVVHQISASGLEGPIEDFINQGANNEEEALEDLLTTTQGANYFGGFAEGDAFVQLRIQETRDSAGPNAQRANVGIDASQFDLIVDEESDEYYVVQDASAYNGLADDEDYEFNVDFAVQDARFLVDADDDDYDQDNYDSALNDEQVTTTLNVEERSLEFGQNPYNVSNVENVTVMGETNVAPGTEFTTRARSDSDTQPSFVKSDSETSVAANGMFTAEFDFSDTSVGDGYTLSVNQLGLNNPEDVEVDGTVVEETTEPASFDVSDLSPAEATATAGDSVTVSATIENTGGQEATQTVALTLDGGELDTTSVTLAGGNSTTVEFTADTSGLEAGDYTHGVATDDDEATGTLTIETSGGDDGGDDSSGDDSSGDDSSGDDSSGDDSSGDDSSGDGSSEDGTPGFGALVALVALIAAALLATRRND